MSAAVLVRDGEISIHAPVKGATRLHDRHHAECGHFNPRSREGSDRVKVVRQRHVTGISIHAPVKGATAQGGNPALPALNFNPRSREGSDNSGYVRRMNRIYFNPRSREGSDRSILNTTLHNIISIHAPAKGATHGRYACHLRQIISIHAPAKGATHQASDKYNPGIFQSTLPRRERRPANGRFRCAPPHFNPRSREGSDSTLCGGNLFLICISIHAPAKGATEWLNVEVIE